MTINVQSAADPTQKHEYEGVRPFGWWTVSASLQSSSLCTIADTDLYLFIFSVYARNDKGPENT